MADYDERNHERSCCPIACALDHLGDKWTLLIIRDLLLGKKRYQEFLESPEQIATNILANRLKKLEAAGLLTQQVYQKKPIRYEYVLTAKGEDLRMVLQTLAEWGRTYYPGTKVFTAHV
ncbi:MAG: helix-turn-helix domain-containing protein [Methylococcales bacterium]|uniref:winged helix-turn-helix transcriptional regulator n=1 Tax=Nitrosomonas sp. TaxID=42353 RepID=UPI0025E83C86|nr:helix-turn-helix domain-containing protein [Nitrosomonas sp.]MDP1614648.1 helix-turn-helix domain-containing protein [Methylococcales bacterium]